MSFWGSLILHGRALRREREISVCCVRIGGQHHPPEAVIPGSEPPALSPGTSSPRPERGGHPGRLPFFCTSPGSVDGGARQGAREAAGTCGRSRPGHSLLPAHARRPCPGTLHSPTQKVFCPKPPRTKLRLFSVYCLTLKAQFTVGINTHNENFRAFFK